MDSYKKTDFDFKFDLKSVVGFIVFLFAVVHIFLLLQYGTFLPCEAAAIRAVNAQYASLPRPKSNAEALGQAMGKSLTENMTLKMNHILMSKKSISYCYAIALKIKEPE